MRTHRLLITPQTNVLSTQGDVILFRIPRECPYTLKVGNTITIKAKGTRPEFKAFVVRLDGKYATVTRKARKGTISANRQYKVTLSNIIACDGVDCKHKLSSAGRRRLTRVERYNDYKEDLLTEAKRIGFDLPWVGACITFFMPMPKDRRWTKQRRKDLHMKWKHSKPDIKNLLAAFEDGLMKKDEGIAFYSGLAKLWVDNPTGWIEVEEPETEEDFVKLARRHYQRTVEAHVTSTKQGEPCSYTMQ
jgi:Holliday junction resolvase RusA-like endonuclease